MQGADPPLDWFALQGFPYVAYALDRALRFRCVNAAWDQFAVAGQQNPIALDLQEHLEHSPDGVIIVNDKDDGN